MTLESCLNELGRRAGVALAPMTPEALACDETSDAAKLCADPQVSVFIPMYNLGPRLDEALAGVLAQDADFPFEVVLCDDCSTDDTATPPELPFSEKLAAEKRQCLNTRHLPKIYPRGKTPLPWQTKVPAGMRWSFFYAVKLLPDMSADVRAGPCRYRPGKGISGTEHKARAGFSGHGIEKAPFPLRRMFHAPPVSSF